MSDFFSCFVPGQVDIPMWTTDAEAAHQARGASKGHNRIVRIPPGESVVLNSAERAPYLLMIEILVGDLDFDPSKRSNKELLKRMVQKEAGAESLRRRSDVDGPPRSSTQSAFAAMSTGPPAMSPTIAFSSSPPIPEFESDEPPLSVPMSNTTSLVPSEPPEDDEEIDLVEQLYGNDVSVRSQAGDLSDSIVLPAAPKNKALDAAAWLKGSPQLSRASSRTNSPSLLPVTPRTQNASNSMPPSPLGISTDPTDLSPSPRHQVPLSLEDYSERMRTAAIMLAQLNANLVREPVVTISAPPNGSSSPATLVRVPPAAEPSPTTPAPPQTSSWFSGGSWISGTKGDGEQPTPPVLRMKVQYSEATSIRDKIMQEMMALEEERMERMKEPVDAHTDTVGIGDARLSAQAAEDESIVRKELNKVDPSGMAPC